MKNQHLKNASELQLDPTLEAERARVVRKAWLLATVAVGLLLSGLAWALIARQENSKTLSANAAKNGILQVNIAAVKSGSYEAKLTLPGTLQGIFETQIYARTTGYVKEWHKDIGQPVKKGDLLATLDIPEVNKQVEEAKVNFELAKAAYERWAKLREQNAVSLQEYDEKLAAFKQTDAVYKRLREQQGFALIVAPFDGIVTRRNIDNGNLVNAGNGGAGQALFAMAQIDKLRLYVYVPEDRAYRVHIGDSVDILSAESAGKPVNGRIIRTAGAIDTATHTLQIEIQVPNAEHRLLPGSYITVALTLKSETGLTLPTNTLMFGTQGSRVAVVSSDGRVKLQVVTPGTDYGRDIEIKSGVKAGDKVIVNPPDSITDGQTVTISSDNTKGS